MNYTILETSCKQNNQNFSKKIPSDTLSGFCEVTNKSRECVRGYKNSSLFSYLISPDTNKTKDKKRLVKDYIYNRKKEFYKLVLQKYDDCNDYVNHIFINRKFTGELVQLDYRKSQEYKIKDDINYKNSYINYAYKRLQNPTSIFVTNTLKSDKYHPFFDDGKTLNPILQNSDNPKEAFDRMVFNGYVKLEEAREDFYKQRVFRDNKLTKDKRALILAIEPHKTFVPHTHKLEIIEEKYIKEYIHYTIENHIKFELGRTEIAIFEKSFDLIKDDYVLTFKNGNFYYNDYIYFKVLEQKSDTEIQSISNYMTKYIEQSYIIDSNEEVNLKKDPILYSAFAYYIASLKDKYIPKKDGTKYKKIRRIRYARLLISKEIYRKIMTKEFIEFLTLINKYHKQNMYLHITELLNSNELEIYRYFKVDNSSGEILKQKVYYIDVKIRNFSQRIDLMMNEIFKAVIENGNLQLKSITKYQKINLLNQSHYKERYNFKDDSECIIIDEDVLKK